MIVVCAQAVKNEDQNHLFITCRGPHFDWRQRLLQDGLWVQIGRNLDGVLQLNIEHGML